MEDGDNGNHRRGGRENKRKSNAGSAGKPVGRPRERYAALDLGTNNCRLLIAAPQGRRLRIVDAFSRIVRLGEGLAASGKLSDAAMARSIDAIQVCAEKIRQRGATHIRCIATQACRSAENGDAFLSDVANRTGLDFEIIGPEEEARLAVSGCAELIDVNAKAALIFDIGGGSTELSWMKKNKAGQFETTCWMSMPIGVVNLSERWGGQDLSASAYKSAVEEVRASLQDFGDPSGLRTIFSDGQGHFLGTSGTVTSIAGLHLELPRYRRDKVDGLWLSLDDARAVTERLRGMSLKERGDEPCIGPERADLVVCGCAILDALAQEWPVNRIRVADRGLREGMLAELSVQAKRVRRTRRRRSKSRNRKAS